MAVKDGSKIFLKNKDSNKYLLYLRDNKPNIPYPGMWDTFGGGVEEKETPIETAIREIQEEINIPVLDIKQFARKDRTHIVEGITYNTIAHYFIGNIEVDNISEIHLKEGRELKYFSLKEILNRDDIANYIKDLILEYKEIFNS